MSIDTLYNLSYSSPAQIVDEQYTDVGSSSFQLGTYKRAFKGGTELEIYDGTDSDAYQLVENVDYELLEKDIDYTDEAGFNVYTKVRILNSTYQSGDIFITYKCIGTYTDVDIINDLITDFNSILAQIIDAKVKLVMGKGIGGVFWGEVVKKDGNEIIIKPKAADGFDPFIGVLLPGNDSGEFLELDADYTVKFDTPANSGHFLDGITALLANTFYKLWAYKNSSGDLAFGTTAYMATTFTDNNPTNELTLNQINSQDIGLLYPEDSKILVYNSATKLESWIYNQTDGYTPSGECSVLSRIATKLTLDGNLSIANFSASDSVIQVGGFKPLAIDGEIADEIGARGYVDTGLVFRTNATPAIISFIVTDDGYMYYEDGDMAADLDYGYENSMSPSTSWVIYKLGYIPPDKKIAILNLSVNAASVYRSQYFSTYGIDWGHLGGDGREPIEVPVLHSLLRLKVSANTGTVGQLGFKI